MHHLLRFLTELSGTDSFFLSPAFDRLIDWLLNSIAYCFPNLPVRNLFFDIQIAPKNLVTISLKKNNTNFEPSVSKEIKYDLK